MANDITGLSLINQLWSKVLWWIQDFETGSGDNWSKHYSSEGFVVLYIRSKLWSFASQPQRNQIV